MFARKSAGTTYDVNKAKNYDIDLNLTNQQYSLWAKTDISNDEQRGFWLPLYVHMADSANIAQHLWEEWLPTAERRLIINSVGGDDTAAEALVVWLAGIHDIGKATPNFQCKVPDRAEEVLASGLKVPPIQRMHGNFKPHAFMGEVIVDEWLSKRGWDFSGTYSCIVGGHHGAPPSSEQELNSIKTNSCNFPNEVLGDFEWQLIQEELLNWMLVFSGVDRYEVTLQSLGLIQPVEVLITGLVIMADWIASNTDFFPLLNGPTQMSECFTLNELYIRADSAWKSLALPPAWHAPELTFKLDDDTGNLFHRRFASLPKDAHLRPAQKAAIEAALKMDEPGLIIIEAPMGNGKTEASLLCAEILACKFGDGGLAYLLPTMATSNAMFTRVEDWLKLLAQNYGAPLQTMQLLHSKSALNSDYTKLRKWHGSWMGDGENAGGEDEWVIAHQWFGGRKRGLLASFVVGTVDQLLMAALKTKHVQLRHLGLAGKVVIIDEVHAYDTYMSAYLRRVLTWLGAYGVPTILLSATLPSERRKELMHAYRGHDKNLGGRPSKRKDIPNVPRLSSGKPAYPLVTSMIRNKEVIPAYDICAVDGTGTDVQIGFLSDSDETLIKILSDLLSGGGCACVLRDTVSRAQTTYRMLEKNLDGELGGAQIKLVHSRFIAADRLKNDAELLEFLGPNSSKRPKKFIVVGTQVMEQSLDIDFDVMITDVAPVDLLLQRIGRLHRHVRGEKQSERPVKLRDARCYVTGVGDWEADFPVFARGIDKVYPEALLLRTILALYGMRNAKGSIVVNLPHDIADLVENVYLEPNQSVITSKGCLMELNSWVPQMKEAELKLKCRQDESEHRASIWLLQKPSLRDPQNLIGWLRESFSVTDENIARATVRDSQESIEVIAVQECEENLYVFPWVNNTDGSKPVSRLLGNGEEVPPDNIAQLAATCTVNLPPALSGLWNAERVIKTLESSCQIYGWQKSRWLRGQLALVFDEAGETVIDTGTVAYRLKYSQDSGLELVEIVETKEGE